MRPKTWLVAALLCGSGFCALVYQIGWLREFRLIFGASTAASAAVLAIFVGGLGAGGLLLGPRADRHPRPLVLYAQLEFVVALSAALTPWLLMAVQSFYLASGGTTRLGGALATVVRVALSAVVLAVPTLAMGGTLPAAARAATRAIDDRRRDVAALYALNTLGAVLGCVVGTFWLLEIFGTRATLWLAATVNLLVAATAFAAARVFGSERGEPRDDTADEPVRTIPSLQPSERPRASKRSRRSPTHDASAQGHTAAPTPSSAASAPVAFLLLASGTVGFAFFLMELVWYRMLAPLLGGSVFTFGLVLAVALVGVGIGGLAYAVLSGDTPPALSGFASTCLIEGAVVAAAYALGDRVAMLAATLVPLEMTGFGARIVGWTIVTAVVVLGPALVAGYQFPLLLALFGRARHNVGTQVGLAYAANTCGAVIGSLAGGFGLLPWLSAPGAWRLVAVVLVTLGAVAVVLGASRHAKAPTAPLALGMQGACALVAVACVMAAGPTAVWRHSGIGAGRVATAQVFSSTNRFREWASAERHNVVWEGDGTESSVALVGSATGYAFFVNGKSDGSARSDAGTQVMLGLLGALADPGARRALVIGLGTGSSAGWLGAVPSLERVDVVELEPLVLDVARACTAVNHDVLQNPKVHVTIGDARETLRTAQDRYDIIASEPSNPYRAGVASLFTLEYYRAAADRLAEDGVFAQWVQGYEIDARTLRAIYATLATVFPQIDTWHTNAGDIVLVASKRRHAYRASDLAHRITEEPFRTALAQVWRAVDIHGVLAHYVASDALARTILNAAGVAVNTDDHNVVEFGLARSVGAALTTVADIRNAARGAGTARPPLEDDASVDWPKVDTAWISYNSSVGSFVDTRYQGPPNEQARQAALVQYYRNNDVPTARGLWEQQAEGGRDPAELAMLADITVGTASDESLPFIERLRIYKPGEADVMLATLRVRQSKTVEAAAAIEAALTRFRTDPWSHSKFMDRAVQIADIVSERDAALARRMYDALAQPFAVQASESNRVLTRATIAMRGPLRGQCNAAVGALEPDVPWTEAALRLRRDCYQATNDMRLATASRDLADFLEHAAEPLVAP